jgi:transposase
MCKRMYPITREFFDKQINPLITSCYSLAGRPQRVSNYQVFCAMLYVLRTGIPWRDLPTNYGYWHTVYLRFKKASDRGVWWYVLMRLQQSKKVHMNIVLADSTTIKIHRQGGGLKGGYKVEEEA